MIVQRTETHIIKESHPIYRWIVEECSRSKNLYNKTLFIYRQAFTGKHDNIPEFKDIIKHDKFIAQAWYDSHAEDEDKFYYYDKNFEAHYKNLEK